MDIKLIVSNIVSCILKLKEKLEKHKNKIFILFANLLGIIIVGFCILKASIYLLSPNQYKEFIKDCLYHSKILYKLSLSLSKNEKIKKYLNTQDLDILRDLLNQFFLSDEKIKIVVYSPNLIKLVDIPSYKENNKGLFIVVKDSILQNILSVGVGGYFLKPGEYGFEFSGISPVYYNNQIIGLIEVKQIYEGAVIVPKVYKEYIKYASIKDIGNYIVINSNYDTKLLKDLIKEGKVFENGKYIFLEKYKDYYFIHQIDLTKFLILFLSTYIFFAILYLILIWKYLFGKRIETIDIKKLEKKLEAVPYIIFSEDGQILSINLDKWKYYMDTNRQLKTILDTLKCLDLKDPISFYENYFKNLNSYQEVRLKLKDKTVKLKLFPIFNTIKLLLLEDLTIYYKQINKLKKEKEHLEDLINELKLLLKTKNNKIAELKLQLYFLKQSKNEKNNS